MQITTWAATVRDRLSECEGAGQRLADLVSRVPAGGTPAERLEAMMILWTFFRINEASPRPVAGLVNQFKAAFMDSAARACDRVGPLVAMVQDAITNLAANGVRSQDLIYPRDFGAGLVYQVEQAPEVPSFLSGDNPPRPAPTVLVVGRRSGLARDHYLLDLPSDAWLVDSSGEPSLILGYGFGSPPVTPPEPRAFYGREAALALTRAAIEKQKRQREEAVRIQEEQDRLARARREQSAAGQVAKIKEDIAALQQQLERLTATASNSTASSGR